MFLSPTVLTRSRDLVVAAVLIVSVVRLALWWTDFDPTVAPDDFESRQFWRKRRRVQARRRRLQREQKSASARSSLLSYLPASLHSLLSR